MDNEELPKEEEGQIKGRTGKKTFRSRTLSVQQSQKSLESTLKSEWSKRESTLIESAEAEGNPRDILNARISELEGQLKEVEDRYSRLTEEARVAREQYEAERCECEDVVFVAKRNVKRLVDGILKRQQRKRELGRSIEKADEDSREEDRQRAQHRSLEEERLIKNIVLLQTKLLIMEGKRFERDRLLKKIMEAEEEASALDKRHEEALESARERMKIKYEQLNAALVSRVRDVSEAVWNLTRAQQSAALAQRQRSIVETQGRYRRAVQLALRLRDRKRILQEERASLQKKMEIETSLAEALVLKAGGSRLDLLTAFENLQKYQRQDVEEGPRVNTEEFEAHIKELETMVFRKKDHKAELKLIFAEQEDYKRSLDKDEAKRTFWREKLLSMSQVAEMVLGRGAMTQEPPVSSPNPSERSEFLEKMSTILLETAEDPANFSELQTPRHSSDEQGRRSPYMRGLLGLVPKESHKAYREGSTKSYSSAPSSGPSIEQRKELSETA